MVSLNNEFTKIVAQSFANATELFCADIEELIKFDLIDVVKAEAICGPEYLKKVERTKIKNVSSFDNACIVVNYNMLNDEVNLNNLKEFCVIVCVDFGFETYKSMMSYDMTRMFENVLNKEMFNIRKKLLSEYADVLVHYTSKDKDLTNKIISKLQDYYKK